jgi:hypothetical protein
MSGTSFIPEKELRYDLTGPCGDCPFRDGVAFHEGICSSLPTLMSRIDLGDLVHTCHKTHPGADGFNPSYRGPVQHCGGLLAMMSRDATLITGPQARALECGRWRPELTDPAAPVFKSMVAMLRHYYTVTVAMLERRKAERSSA